MPHSYSTRKTDKLKSCPFCDSEALFTTASGDYGYTSSTMGIKCSKCWCEHPSVDTEKWESGRDTFSIALEVEANLIEAWNTRNGKCLQYRI